MNKPIQLAFAALALCAAQQCSAALPLSFPVARDWLYERSDKLKASEEQVQSKRETQKSLETLGRPNRNPAGDANCWTEENRYR